MLPNQNTDSIIRRKALRTYAQIPHSGENMAIKGRVLLVDPILKEAAGLLLNDGEIEVDIYKIKEEKKSLGELAAGYDALIVTRTPITREIIKEACAGGRLRMISQVGDSVDNIDLEATVEHNLIVMNSPGYDADAVREYANAVAEYALGLLLSVSRNIPQGRDIVRRGHWGPKQRLIGSEIKGKTLGVLGLGEDGQLVAEKAKALGMEVIVEDPNLPLRDRERLAKELGAKHRSLDDLLKNSDYVTLHLPEAKPKARNYHLIGKRELELMKGSAYLINTVSSGAVDERALYAALRKDNDNRSVIRGAALDAVEKPDDRLLKLSNLIITPGYAISTANMAKNQAMEAVRQVLNAIKHNAYKNVVNR